MASVAGLGRFAIFVSRVVRATATHRVPWRESLEQAYTIGVRSLPILLVISAFIGTNLTLQGYAAFKPMGGQHMVGMFVALGGLREMAPIMVAAMVAAKAGTEMASAIAVMRTREQIDALEVMAVDPYWTLVTPRFLGIMLVLPPLTMISNYTLILSGWLVATLQLGLSGDDFLYHAARVSNVEDLGYGVIKAAVFSAVICLVSTYHGFTSRPGPVGVGRATNTAVVMSAVVCSILNYALSELMYG